MTEYCLRVMVLSIIMYDQINGDGVFIKTSPMKVRQKQDNHTILMAQVLPCLKVIKIYGGPNVISLLNSLRYGTIHFNEETTPKSIKTFIAENTAA